jgi:negative regulator of sigma E activity
LIGDVIRENTSLHLDIKHQVMERLASEPITFAPPRRSFGLPGNRYMTSMAASIAAVGFVAWVVWQSQAIPNQANPVPTNIVQNPSPQNILTAESFDHYMLAHHEYASSNNLQRDMQLTSYTEADH